MRKAELIDLLVSDYWQDESELKKMTKAELEELLDDLTDESDMFPNGRDYDAENEDGI